MCEEREREILRNWLTQLWRLRSSMSCYLKVEETGKMAL
jgi:hypothetical protein